MKIWAKPPLKNVKNPLPVDVRRSKTPLLKLPNIVMSQWPDLVNSCFDGVVRFSIRLYT